MAFDTARRLFAELHEWAPSSRATLRMMDAVGAEVRGFLDADPVPEDDGEVLVIQVDGRGAPMITSTEHARRPQPKRREKGTRRHARRLRRREHPRPRRKKGDKSKNAKIAFVGVIYVCIRRAMDGKVQSTSGSSRPSRATKHSAWLAEHAKRRGYGRKRSFLPRRRLRPHLALSREVFHESRARASTGTTSQGSRPLSRARRQHRARSMGERQLSRLRRGKVAEMIDTIAAAHNAIPKTGPGNKGRRKRLLAILEYLSNHEHRMPSRMRSGSGRASSGFRPEAPAGATGGRVSGRGRRGRRSLGRGLEKFWSALRRPPGALDTPGWQ
jgi:hypothetical protein